MRLHKVIASALLSMLFYSSFLSAGQLPTEQKKTTPTAAKKKLVSKKNIASNKPKQTAQKTQKAALKPVLTKKQQALPQNKQAVPTASDAQEVSSNKTEQQLAPVELRKPEVTKEAAVPAGTLPPMPSKKPLTTPAQEHPEKIKQPEIKPLPQQNSSDDDDDDPADEDDEEDQDEAEEKALPLTKKIMIRVLLKELPIDQKITFAIQSNKGFVLESPIGSGKQVQWHHQILNLLAHDNNLFLLTESGTYKRIKTNEIGIASVDGELKIDNYRYKGAVYLKIDQKKQTVQMVNKVNLDDYIYAVLRYESLSYWPLEMQKVQAVASRTYAVRQIKTARSNEAKMPFYDIKNNNFHQVYNGNHDYVHLRKAVDETHNLILTYNDNIALTMFDICCGGIIPGYMKKRDADKPYLFRKTRCTYCQDKANYEWQYSINKETLLQRMLDTPKLATKAKKLGKIVGISLKEKDRAGIAHRILIHGSRNNIIFTNNEFKAALGAHAKSSAYSVKKSQNDIVTHGYGFGHNIGLCQIGARELVAKGKSYQEILEFYYPKTKLMKLRVI